MSSPLPSPPPATIELLVSPTGQGTLRTSGFVGPSCREASRVLEQALGLVQAEQLTAEFHQSQDLHEPQRNSQRG